MEYEQEWYEVELSDDAESELDAFFNYIAETLFAPAAARRLVRIIKTALFSLDMMPYRCPLSRNEELARKGVRVMIIGDYTAPYTIDEKHRVVTIAHVIHGPADSNGSW